MSYCRCSAKSDIYALRSNLGYEIYVSQASAKPLSGKSFIEKTPESFLKRLTKLRDAGYKVPRVAFDRIKRETST